jgi:CubicO group peptidase (beta-lactamase class C family)
MKQVFLCLLLALAIPGFHQAQSLAKKADKLLNTYQQKGQLDGSVLIARGKDILYSRQFGVANRQFNVPVGPGTKFPIASVTKLYAAILVLALQQEGKLHIDSSVATYLPQLLPRNGSKITLRQLLNHFSGLPNDKVADYTALYRPMDFLKKRVADTLLFTPGSKYRYNNINYILLACVIEQVSGKKWETLLEEKIISPLKLRHTGVVKRDSVIRDLAYGYHNYAFGNPKVKDPLENDEPIYLENYALAGALFTTPAELWALQQALKRHEILDTATLKLLYTVSPQRDKPVYKGYQVTPGGYLGTELIGQKKVNIIERNGNINGYNATYLQLPESGHTLIIFCNTDAGNLEAIARELLEILLTT